MIREGACGRLPAVCRSLRTGRSGLIGLAIPGLADPYFSRVAEAVIDAAARRGISVLVEQTTGDPTREGDVLLGRRPTIVDGLIFSPISITQQALDEASPAVPLVLLGEHLMVSQRTRVAVDNVAASVDAVTHLLSTGRSAVAVRIPDADVVSLLTPGQRVSLVATDPQGGQEPETVAADAAVVAIPRPGRDAGPTALGGRLVVFAVPSGEAGEVLAAGTSRYLGVVWTR